MKHIKWDDIPYEKPNDKFLRKVAYDRKIMKIGSQAMTLICERRLVAG